MNKVIQVQSLKKYFQVYQKEPGFLGSIRSLFFRKYTPVKAVDGISFEISQGELVGFIGPNGAGKTTTLKVLSGLLFPTGGQIRILGFEPFKRQRQFQTSISLVMGQKNQLWWDLPPLDSFILNKEIYGISNDLFKKNVGELSEMLRVTDILKVPVRKLSLGQRMKCELIAALLHSPKILFLDEPTIGLDVVAQKNMRDFIKDYNAQFGATIILTSHYMSDVQKLCKRVIIIDEGKIVYDGLLEKIVNKFAPYKLIKIDFDREINPDSLKKFGSLEEYSTTSAQIKIKKSEVASLTNKLLSEFDVADLTIEEASIEDIIREIFEAG